VPSRKEIKWSQLRVGALVLSAMVALIVLIFLMSGSTGGLFARKIRLRSYFANAAGIKDGAPVTLEDVTIGTVVKVRLVPERNPRPVEVTMQVGYEFIAGLHTDSTAAIDQAGVLGDSYIDITSKDATGPEPAPNAELKAGGAPNIQEVISTSEGSIKELTALLQKIEITVDAINDKRGTMGELVNDPELYRKISSITTDLQTITSAIASGKGSLGKLVNDDTMYSRANSAIDKLDKITTDLNDGKGSAGKFLKDDKLYDNLSSTITNANQLISEINQGKGSLGKLAKDPVFAQKLDDTVTHLDSILTTVDEGKGSIGQLVKNRSLYDHADQTLDESQKLVKSIRDDPRKYLVIRLKVF